MKKTLLAVISAVVVLALGAGAWIALASPSEATERGTCDGRTYELSVEDDDNGLEVSFELQSAGPGEVWEISLQQGDTSLLAGERTTDEDGEVDLDAPGEDDGSGEFTATATPADGSAACTATLTR